MRPNTSVATSTRGPDVVRSGVIESSHAIGRRTAARSRPSVPSASTGRATAADARSVAQKTSPGQGVLSAAGTTAATKSTTE